MRKFVFVLSIVLVFSGTALAVNDADVGNFSPGAIANTGNNNIINSPGGGPVTNQGGTGVGVGIGIAGVENTFNPTNINAQGQSQKQGQIQIQGQDQFQGQNNDQKLVNVLKVEPAKRVAIGTAPQDSGQSELNFIAPNERDVTTVLPSFGCGTIKKLSINDCIVDVVWQSNDVKFKDLYKEVLRGVRSDEVTKSKLPLRYQIWEAASSKSWTTGGNLSGNGVGQIGTVVGGGSAGIFPQMGRSKSSNLYTIIFVQVQEFKK